MKHYVKIRSGGQTVADALIEAESAGDAVKKALRGEGIDLSRVKPDESYSVSSGDVMSSSFGDEFQRTADWSGDDRPNMDGHLHRAPLGPGDSGIHDIPDAIKREVRERAREFLAGKVFPKECAHDFNNGGVINRAGCAHEYDPTPDPTLDRCRHCGDFRPVPFDPAEEKRMRAADKARRMGATYGMGADKLRELADSYVQNPADILERMLEDEGLEIDHEAIAKARKHLEQSLGVPSDLLGIDPGAEPQHVNCRSQVTPIMTTLEFDFECDCGAITSNRANIPLNAPSPYEHSHRCPVCGANHVTRIEQ